MTAAIKDALTRVMARINSLSDEEFRDRLNQYRDNALTVALKDAARVIDALCSFSVRVESHPAAIDLDSIGPYAKPRKAANDPRFLLAA